MVIFVLLSTKTSCISRQLRSSVNLGECKFRRVPLGLVLDFGRLHIHYIIFFFSAGPVQGGMTIAISTQPKPCAVILDLHA